MNDNTTITVAGDASTPLMENQYVKELFNILNDNNRDTAGLSALINHVNSLEDFVKKAEDKITVMKSQLDSMKEIQEHPVKNALKKTIKSLETKVAEIKTQIADLKNGIIEGCKDAIAAFKDRGITALDKLMSFFHIKNGLRSMDKNIDANIREDRKALAKIEAFSKEYHKSGRALRNMGRVLIGKEPIDAAKESGKLAKAIGAPYKADIVILVGMKKTINKMVVKLEQLENSAVAKREARAEIKKPSIMRKLKDNKELIRQKDLEKPVPERAPKVKGLEV